MEQYLKIRNHHSHLYYHPSGMFLNLEEESDNEWYTSTVLIPFDFHHLFPREWRPFYSKSRHATDFAIPYISLVITKRPSSSDKKFISISTDWNQPHKPTLFMLDSQVNWKWLFIKIPIPRKSLKFYASLKATILLRYILLDVRITL